MLPLAGKSAVVVKQYVPGTNGEAKLRSGFDGEGQLVGTKDVYSDVTELWAATASASLTCVVKGGTIVAAVPKPVSEVPGETPTSPFMTLPVPAAVALEPPKIAKLPADPTDWAVARVWSQRRLPTTKRLKDRHFVTTRTPSLVTILAPRRLTANRRK